MNALAILYVNAHLQDILDDAAERRAQVDRPSVFNRIRSAATGAKTILATPLATAGRCSRARRVAQPELRPPPLAASSITDDEPRSSDGGREVFSRPGVASTLPPDHGVSGRQHRCTQGPGMPALRHDRCLGVTPRVSNGRGRPSRPPGVDWHAPAARHVEERQRRCPAITPSRAGRPGRRRRGASGRSGRAGARSMAGPRRRPAPGARPGVVVPHWR